MKKHCLSQKNNLTNQNLANKQEAFVYYAKIPKKFTYQPVYPPAREKEINSCQNQKVKEQKYFAWKLLESSIFYAFNKNLRDFKFKKSASGKWSAKGIYFSISHSKNYVAVGISLNPIGVDLQQTVPVKKGLENKILTQQELKEFSGTPNEQKARFVLHRFAQKESIFKMQTKKVFRPKKIQTSKFNVVCDCFCDGEDEFYVCACTKKSNFVTIVKREF